MAGNRKLADVIPMQHLAQFLDPKSLALIPNADGRLAEETKKVNQANLFGLRNLNLPVAKKDLNKLIFFLRELATISNRVFRIPQQFAGRHLRDLTDEELVRALNAGMLTNELVITCYRFPHYAKFVMENPKLRRLLPAEEAVIGNSVTQIKNALKLGMGLVTVETTKPPQFPLTQSILPLTVMMPINPRNNLIKHMICIATLIVDFFIGNDVDCAKRSAKAFSLGMFIGTSLPPSVASVAATVEQKPRHGRAR